jgi:hypothetical protein
MMRVCFSVYTCIYVRVSCMNMNTIELVQVYICKIVDA